MSLNVLEERGIVMIMNMICKNVAIVLITLTFLASCGSTQEKPTKDICSIKKHWKDNVFQVLINDKAINKHFYIHSEALEISKGLAKKNKCMI